VKTLQPPPERRNLRACMSVFALVWMAGTCVPLVAVAGMLIASMSSRESPTEMIIPLGLAIVFTVPFFFVGVGLLVWSLWPVVAGLKATRPEVYVSDDAMRPGDTFSFSFRQTFKSAADVKRAALQLVRREMAIYHRGTDTYTVTDEVVAQQFESMPRRFQAGEMFSEQRLLQMPADAMHTFAATHNRIRWLVKVQVGVGGWPDFNEEYEVRVLPERR
jgi:hypothetical protein